MPPPTVLKRRHSLRGKNLLPVVRKMRDVQAVPQLARVKMNVATEDMESGQVVTAFRELTGESEKEFLEMAGRESNEENLKLLLHVAILYANEHGQPDGQDLEKSNDEGNEQEPQRKKVKTSIETRVKELENIKKKEEDLEVENVKEKVRSLALQSKPSIPLLLVTLDELARTARRKGHEDAAVYEELSRQASLNTEKIEIAGFALSVLGGNASDIVGKALSKALKQKPEVKSSEGGKLNAEVQAQSPLMGIYGQPNYFPGYPTHFNAPPMGNPYGYRRYQRPMFRQQRSAGCLFCGATDHFVRTCNTQ